MQLQINTRESVHQKENFIDSREADDERPLVSKQRSTQGILALASEQINGVKDVDLSEIVEEDQTEDEFFISKEPGNGRQNNEQNVEVGEEKQNCCNSSQFKLLSFWMPIQLFAIALVSYMAS